MSLGKNTPSTKENPQPEETYGPHIDLESRSEFYIRKYKETYSKILIYGTIPVLSVGIFMNKFLYDERIYIKKLKVSNIISLYLMSSAFVGMIITYIENTYKEDYFISFENMKIKNFEKESIINQGNLNKEKRMMRNLENKI